MPLYRRKTESGTLFLTPDRLANGIVRNKTRGRYLYNEKLYIFDSDRNVDVNRRFGTDNVYDRRA